MERNWFWSARLVELEIGVMVAVTLMALLAITTRLARDPSEPAIRRWLERTRTSGPISRQTVGTGDQVTLPASDGSDGSGESAQGQVTATPEWLDRLLGRDSRRAGRSQGDSQDQSDPESGRRVA